MSTSLVSMMTRLPNTTARHRKRANEAAEHDAEAPDDYGPTLGDPTSLPQSVALSAKSLPACADSTGGVEADRLGVPRRSLTKLRTKTFGSEVVHWRQKPDACL